MPAEVRIEELTAVDDGVVAAFERLIPQLSSSNPAPTREALERIVASEASALLVAREADGTIVGTTTLVTFPIPTATRAWIEDVVVDEAASGRGISYDLTRHALDLARQAGCGTVDLTSRPSREAANHVYRKLGFEQRSTNVYRYTLDG
jgi:ribosomal protein S18 acetylase RimI-like enzyme